MRLFTIALHLLMGVALILSSCRGDDELLVMPTEQTVAGGGRSFFLLNEGNMGSNKATLDFYDGKTGIFRHNIFPALNPDVALELGDVGNDLAVYGSKLYAIINVSGLVEVMDARTARHICNIRIPNCRYITFYGGKAYVSSYAGPVAPNDPNSRRGIVARIDTASLYIETTCEVGYQPEQMEVADGKLFVANSGGYRAPNYDWTLSVIDLSDFKVTETISVAPNLHLVKLHQDKLYVSSRGDYADTEPDIYIINPKTLQTEGRLGIKAEAFCFYQNELIALCEEAGRKQILRYDLASHSTQNFITDGTSNLMQTPYGIAADEQHKRIYITDARDYVSPGQVFCYDIEGKRIWQAQAGDIPAHFAFTDNASISGEDPAEDNNTKGINRIYEYRPAPGQFVNVLPAYSEGDDANAMNEKVFAAIGEGRKGLVTLGAAGGYLVAGFASRVPNIAGEYDLEILGNAFEGASEAGIVSVMRDDNANGLPDDTWYELTGSAADETRRLYTLQYNSPDDKHSETDEKAPWCNKEHYIAWQDNLGQSGWLAQNIYHQQSYFPNWISEDQLQFTFSLLPDRAYQSGGTWLQPAFQWGYADNLPNGTDGCRFDIGNAIDSNGNPVHLDGIDFVRIHTAVFRQMEAIGEASTEISGISSLH